MALIALAVVGCVLALVPAILFALNLCLYRPASLPGTSLAPPHRAISLLIPARNEQSSIQDCLLAALASQNVDLELIVLDDHSTDATHEIVSKIAASDPRVRIESAPPLPSGWCGKQHACWELSRLATKPLLAFIDADVRLAPDGLAQAAGFLHDAGAGLVSGIPLQETGTWMESLLIPLIHFILLGFLPIQRMRQSLSPAYGAGCGQFFMTTREAYDRSGGHRAIRSSMHDGVTLPRTYRRAGLATDIFDATDIARCRMYRGARQVWNGLAKNATEGLASRPAIVPWTILLLGGQVLPFVLGIWLLVRGKFGDEGWVVIAICAIAISASYTARFAAAARFRQSIFGALLHPLGILLLVTIQWFALSRSLAGIKPAWRGRTVYGPAGEV